MLLEVANAATDALPRAETRSVDMLAVAEMSDVEALAVAEVRNAETQEGRWPVPEFGKRWRRVLVLACLSVVITVAVVAGLSTDEAVTTTTTAVGCVVIVLLAWVIPIAKVATETIEVVHPIPPAEVSDAATQMRSAELRDQAALAVAQVADADTHAIPEVTGSARACSYSSDYQVL